MNFYRIKHKPTGLYYKPGSGNNLTKKGKVYTGGGNVLNYYTRDIPVTADRKLRTELQKHYCGIPDSTAVDIRIPREDFVMEPVNIPQ